MYDRWVKKPNTAEEAETHMHEYTQAGFPGALFSSDGVHVTSERVHARLKNLHLGPKESHTARAYNATVNHRRRVLYTTRGAPSSWNDKILVGFDDLLVGIENRRSCSSSPTAWAGRGSTSTVAFIRSWTTANPTAPRSSPR